MPHHFISYSNADAADFALQLADALATGPPPFPVWLDQRELKPGRNWAPQIDSAIRNCRCLLFVMTVDSVRENSVCEDEWFLALAERKPIIPILLTAGVEAPFLLKRRQHINFAQDFKTGLAELRSYLQWLESPEGELQSFKDNLLDAERELARTFDDAGRAKIERLIAGLRDQIATQESIVAGTSPVTKHSTDVPVIDRDDAIDLFEALLSEEHSERFLFLTGGPKMGKSHLLGKVFPEIAKAKGLEPVLIDLRNSRFSVIEHLRHITNILGRKRFERFCAAYDEWEKRPVRAGDSLEAVLAKSSASERKDESPDTRLTRAFADDLYQDDEELVLLIFDAAERAKATIQRWLIDDLLVRLSPINQVIIVVAGRELPETSTAYDAISHVVALGPVCDADAYVRYCHDIGVVLEEAAVHALAVAFDHTPGLFADTVNSKFLPEGIGYD